ncbi:MAG: acyl-CoA thioesterase [Deltaproteobacteria bacterium]|nr:acyl-CoA thioesterase [Deltaproteobacteria bacterium]
MTHEPLERLRLVTRGYELSPHGHIGPGQFLRYLEHARWHLIGESEVVPLRRFFSMGVVRAQAVELLAPVSFGVELEFESWLSRVGRTSLDVSHDVRRVADGALVARSTATLVALDTERRPSPIGDGATELVLTRSAAPIPRLQGGPSPGEWSRPLELRPSDHDLQGHVNHARYADLVDDARQRCADEGGFGAGSFDGPLRGLALAYERETRCPDPVRAHGRAAEGGDALDVFLTAEDGALLTRARLWL